VIPRRRDRHVRLPGAAGPPGPVRLGAAHREHARAGGRLVWAGEEVRVTRTGDQHDVVAERGGDGGLERRVTAGRRGLPDAEGHVDDPGAVRDRVPDPGRRRRHRPRARAAHGDRQDPGPRGDAHRAGAGPSVDSLASDHHRHRGAVAVLADLDVRVAVAGGPGQVGTGQVDAGQDHAAQVREAGLDPAVHLGHRDPGALGQRPHLPLHLPGGEPPLPRSWRQSGPGPARQGGAG
jgi:hypothetical protein